MDLLTCGLSITELAEQANAAWRESGGIADQGLEKQLCEAMIAEHGEADAWETMALRSEWQSC